MLAAFLFFPSPLFLILNWTAFKSNQINYLNEKNSAKEKKLKGGNVQWDESIDSGKYGWMG